MWQRAYRYPSLHENLHSVSTTMSTPLDDSEDEAEAAGMDGEQLMSPFRGGCNDGQRRKTHLKVMEHNLFAVKLRRFIINDFFFSMLQTLNLNSRKWKMKKKVLLHHRL